MYGGKGFGVGNQWRSRVINYKREDVAVVDMYAFKKKGVMAREHTN